MIWYSAHDKPPMKQQLMNSPAARCRLSLWSCSMFLGTKGRNSMETSFNNEVRSVSSQRREKSKFVTP